MSPIGELREIGAFAARIGEAIDAFKPDLLHAHSPVLDALAAPRSEVHTSELQSLMRNSYAVFRFKKKKSMIYSVHYTIRRSRLCNPTSNAHIVINLYTTQ